MEAWIDITEFATKYGISASTLRRRIRSNTMNYKMEKGKYLLQDSPQALSGAPLFSRVRANAVRQTITPSSQIPIYRAGVIQTATQPMDPLNELMNTQNFSASAHSEDFERLIKENRKLKAQIEELQTLVKALEAEVGGPSA